MQSTTDLIDGIYEAAVLPELWSGVIENVASAIGAYGGSLFTVGASHSAAVASRNCVEHLDALLKGNWGSLNIRAQRLLADPTADFVTDEDIASPEEIENHPIYRDFLRPRGLGWVVGTHIIGADDDIAIFSIDRLHTQGPFDRSVVMALNTLRPHISRAVLLSRRFQEQEAKGALKGLQSVGIPAAGLDARGRVRLMNDAFSQLSAQITTSAADRLHLTDAVANTLLRQSLEDLSVRYGPPMSIGVQGLDDQPPFVLHLTPMRGRGRDLFGGVSVILSIVPLTQPGLPFRMLVQRLYDLTTAEARVAERLIAGDSVKQISQAFGISGETVRSHTKSVLAKTGVSRQMEFRARFSTFLRSKPDTD
jgi:DNA-binding CsgD family transcriptional regulator